MLIAFDLSCPLQLSSSAPHTPHPLVVGPRMIGVPEIFLDLKMRHVILKLFNVLELNADIITSILPSPTSLSP